MSDVLNRWLRYLGVEPHAVQWYVFPERFGKIAFLWSEDQNRGAMLLRILIAQKEIDGLSQDFGKKESSLPRQLEPFYAFIHGLFETGSDTVGGHEPVVSAACGDGAARFIFPIDQIPLHLCPDFQRRTLAQEHRTPPGTVTTYARLAAACGQPRGARAVASALSHNPFPLLIPCHRTVRSDGSLGGYQGGLAMKRWLLEREGVSFLDGARSTNGANHEKPAESGKVHLNSLSFKS